MGWTLIPTFRLASSHAYSRLPRLRVLRNMEPSCWRPEPPLIRCWGNDHYAPDNFVVKGIAPYKPNNFLLFFKTRQSFHSVKAITNEVPNQRYGMQFQFYEPGNGLFKDLSVPDLMSTKHRTAPPKQHVFRTASSPTALKKHPVPAAVLPPEEKIAINPGDIVVCQRQEPNADGVHNKLFGVTLNGREVGAAWFPYSPHGITQESSGPRRQPRRATGRPASEVIPRVMGSDRRGPIRAFRLR